MSYKNPDWYNEYDRTRYNDLLEEQASRELSEEKKHFCYEMYVKEKYACGLDGF